MVLSSLNCHPFYSYHSFNWQDADFNVNFRVINGQELSESYKVARDSREILVDSRNMLTATKESMDRLRNLQQHLSEMHAANSTDPEVYKSMPDIKNID